MAEPPHRKKDPASEPENSWLQIPAVYCDTYTTSIEREAKLVRIIFGDYVSREYRPFYRAAIMMPLANIKSLVRHLKHRIEELEAPEVEIPVDGETEPVPMPPRIAV